MGFETIRSICFLKAHIVFEVSLWDLKHQKVHVDIPTILFEVSLWDLKLKVWAFHKALHGFEVSLWDLKPKALSLVRRG